MGTKTHIKPQIQPNYLKSIPYDYFVVVDAGSHGSRVYVYSWLNPYVAMAKNADFLLKEYSKILEEESDDDSDDETDVEKTIRNAKELGNECSSDYGSKPNTKPESRSNLNSRSKSKSKSQIDLPRVFNLKHWHKVEHVGLATLHDSPKELEHHIKSLLRLASDVVPKSQHYRTPIFVHATAGMRLLPPNQQEFVLKSVCSILQNDSDFYVPDCASHVNIIDGETEGLYGWLALNYLKGFEPDTSFGFLDMGGMSTQVVFQPNKTEAEKHRDSLYNVSLAQLPQHSKKDLYSAPKVSFFDVCTRSFLGLGESEARRKFLEHLALKNASILGSNVEDPCWAKGHYFHEEINGTSINFAGTGDFDICISSVFSVFSEYYKSPEENLLGLESSDCHDITSEDGISSCLANSAHPAFDFQNDKFVGVSEYKKALSDLQKLGYIDKKKGHSYNYEEFHEATKKVCSLDNEKLEKLKKNQEWPDIGKLCFQSSWILNVLHVGFGFPNTGDHGPMLELEEKIDGQKLTWTLGRAVLYANDEYVQAYTNHSGTQDIERPGYKPQQNTFVFGSESGSFYRPRFEIPLASGSYKYFDYESAYGEKSWPLVQVLLLVMMLVAMTGLYRGGLRQVASFYDGITRAVRQAKGYTTLEQEVEMSEFGDDSNNFSVGSDTEEV